MKLFGAVMAAAVAILVYQLFIPPIIGLSDQGDFIRTIGRFGYGPQHQGSLEYSYVEHPASRPQPFGENLARYFGPACPQAELDALTPLEKDAVRLGVVKKGMRKQAVILAAGYPPLRDTPSLDLTTWRYWISRTRYFTVKFDQKGVVEGVVF